MAGSVATHSTRALRLAFGLGFEDLYRRDGLVALDAHFLRWLDARDGALAGRLTSARRSPALPYKEEAALLIALAPLVDEFVGELFGIGEEIGQLRHRHDELGDQRPGRAGDRDGDGHECPC